MTYRDTATLLISCVALGLSCANLILNFFYKKHHLHAAIVFGSPILGPNAVWTTLEDMPVGLILINNGDFGETLIEARIEIGQPDLPGASHKGLEWKIVKAGETESFSMKLSLDFVVNQLKLGSGKWINDGRTIKFVPSKEEFRGKTELVLTMVTHVIGRDGQTYCQRRPVGSASIWPEMMPLEAPPQVNFRPAAVSGAYSLLPPSQNRLFSKLMGLLRRTFFRRRK